MLSETLAANVSDGSLSSQLLGPLEKAEGGAGWTPGASNSEDFDEKLSKLLSRMPSDELIDGFELVDSL